MTSRIDRAFIRAFAKQRGESTPAAESFAPKSVAPIKAAPAQAAPDEAQPEEAALKSPSRVTHRVDESADTPAKPAGIAWQEMPATVNTAVNVEARGLEDMNALEVLSIGEVFPTELFEGRIDNGVPNIPNIEDKATVVPSLSPEGVRRRLDEAEALQRPTWEQPEEATDDVGEVVFDDVLSRETIDQALSDLDVFSPGQAEEEEGHEGSDADEGADADELEEQYNESIDDHSSAEQEETPLLHIKGPFVPAWEADEIRWPRMADRLQTLDDRFNAAGRQLAQAAREGLRTLAVSSTYRGEGRTTIAMNLARSASSAGIRVALVDGDVDNPALASSGGIAAAHGWHECLAGGLPLDEAAVASIGDGVTLLPLTSAVRRASVAASGAAFASMIEALSLHFDLIIVDYGPLGEHPSPMVGDAAMLVRDIRCTSAEQALTAVRKIRELGPRSVGIVQNFT